MKRVSQVVRGCLRDSPFAESCDYGTGEYGESRIGYDITGVGYGGYTNAYGNANRDGEGYGRPDAWTSDIVQ